MSKLSKFDIQRLAEDFDLEVKKATGPDGKGKVPKSFFESYSAMANTDGGGILLGIEEKPSEVFTVVGIENPTKFVNELWDGLNNHQRVNINFLRNSDVKILKVSGLHVVRVHIPRATRTQRPVFVGQNPMTGTYRRNFRGDYRCDDATVRRMLAEQIEETRDALLLENFDMEDIDNNAFRAYRNEFKPTRPDHPWLAKSDKEFLQDIGG